MVPCAIFLLMPKATTATWSVESIDTSKYFRELSSRALAIDGSGYPHIAYGKQQLYYTYYDGSSWCYETADESPDTGWYANLALDSNDRLKERQTCGSVRQE